MVLTVALMEALWYASSGICLTGSRGRFGQADNMAVVEAKSAEWVVGGPQTQHDPEE